VESDIPKRSNGFVKLSPSIDLRSWIGNSAAVLARGVCQFVVAIKPRRELSRLADFDDSMLADIGLMRRDLYQAHCEPFWRDPTSVLKQRVRERRMACHPRAALQRRFDSGSRSD
jgi:uncharacterized protein YjiS (DUF1127 family)